MKPIFAVDLTDNKKNDDYDGHEFIVAKPSSVMSHTLDATNEDAAETVEKSKLPIAIRILQWICGAIGLLGVTGILKAMTGEDAVTFTEAYHNASWLFWLVGGSIAVWLLLKLVGNIKEKSVFESEEAQELASQIEKTYDRVYEEMNVPADATETEVLSFFYKMKDGKLKVCEKGLQFCSHFNSIVKIFADEENLYLANEEAKFGFPLASLRSIIRVDKNIRLASWNKDKLPTQGEFKQYKLVLDNYNCVHAKYYYILEIDRNGEPWGIYFPCYELPVFEKFTGLKAEKTPDKQ